MSFEVFATKRFLKEFKKLDENIQKRIKERIKELQDNPYKGVPLTAGFKGKYKIRVGEYRIIYTINLKENRVYLLAIGLRKNVYKRENY